MKSQQHRLVRLAALVGMLAMSFAWPKASVADGPQWKAQADLATPGWLPVSAAYSADGKMLVLGGAAGEVAAFDSMQRTQMWKVHAGGGLAAVAFSADKASVLATGDDGVQFLDALTGQPGIRLEQKQSFPTAVGVFPDREIAVEGMANVVDHKVIFGNARGYFVREWIKLEGAGSIELTNVAAGKEPADADAVPLAVDPGGRSVVITGPIHQDTGKNVLWAWVAGNYDEGSPGNRLLEGHDAPVVSAGWSRNGEKVVTGDAAGRVIVWDAATMKEANRREAGERIAAAAISPDGKQIAAVTIGKEAKYHVWDAAGADPDAKPLAVDAFDYSGQARACIAFSPNGRQLVASAINMVWLTRTGKLVGKLHVWEAAQP